MDKIEELIIKSLKNLQEIWLSTAQNRKGKPYYPCPSENKTALVFPSLYDENREKTELRFSEQEARFAFTAVLEGEENKEYCYSVETPTIDKYVFSEYGDPVPRIATEEDKLSNKNENKDMGEETEEGKSTKGQSASVDICLWQEGNPCYIEFKANNPKQQDFSKDFLKLLYDLYDINFGNKKNYFIHVIDSFNDKKITADIFPNETDVEKEKKKVVYKVVDKKGEEKEQKPQQYPTLKSIAIKYGKALLAATNGAKTGNVHRNPNRLTVFLCFMKLEKVNKEGESKDVFNSLIKNTSSNESREAVGKIVKELIDNEIKDTVACRYKVDVEPLSDPLDGFKIVIEYNEKVQQA